MALQSEQNLYPGINAHLNSILQNEPGGWQSFHAGHVTHLFETIDANLPPGYFARSEKTMQISEIIPAVGPRSASRTTPDVMVFQSVKNGGQARTALAPTPPSRSI